MKKQHSRFIIWGMLIMAAPLLLRVFFNTPDSTSDFIKGIGAGIIIGGFIVNVWYLRKHRGEDKEMT